MPREVKITSEGITTALRKLKYSENTFPKSIAEYIWNGYDAGASTVEIDYEFNAAGLRKLIIKDNGHGIHHDELVKKFTPLFESDKLVDGAVNKHSSKLHGRNGLGRLTFFTFCTHATWDTIYIKNRKKYSYSIKINAKKLDFFSGTEESPKEATGNSGTVVTFSDFKEYPHFKYGKNQGEVELISYLKNTFCWFLELNRCHNYKLIINGQDLDYFDLVEDREAFTLTHEKTKTQFVVKYIRWKNSLSEEYSRFYYLDDRNNEIYTEYTTLNKKGDNFYHSLFISSQYFKGFKFESKSDQELLSETGRTDETFKWLIEQLTDFLRKRRKPFLRKYAQKLIDEFEKEGVIVKKDKDAFQLIQIGELEDVIQEIFTTQPKIFANLNTEQQKILIDLLNLVLNSNEREKILTIVERIVELEPEERGDLAKILETTELQKIIKTIQLLTHRKNTLDVLKRCVFEKEFGANEINHLQPIIEENTWIFGEKYALIAAAEDTFEVALQKHRAILSKNDEKVKMTHPDKNKQVDLFLCWQDARNSEDVNNIIVEIKHPQKRIGLNQLNQVKTYLQVIRDEARFNAISYTWEFLLIGSKFDDSGLMENELKNSERKGERGLVQDLNNQKIYVKTWSDVINECERRHNFITDKLELRRNQLIGEIKTPDQAVEFVFASSEKTKN
jgi:hypothetical protein